MVDVEQGALGALEEQPLARLDGVEEIAGRVRDEGAEPVGVAAVLGEDLRGVERDGGRAGPLPGGEQPVLEIDDVGHLGGKVVPVEITQADRQRAAHLVAVARPDAPAGRADRLATRQAAVEDPILGDVPGEDDVRPVAELELAVDPHAPRLEAVDLLDDARGIEHDAAGDDAGDSVTEDAAGDQRQFPGLAAGDHGVAGVRAALVADDDLVVLGEDVDEFALGLVAPLQTDDTGAGHGMEILTTSDGRRLQT